MIDDLELRPEGGGPSLFLFTIYFNDTHFEAEAYNAAANAPEGTVYRVTGPDGVTSRFRSEQSIRQGLHFHPGDPEHYGQLEEAPLFTLLESA